MNTRNWIIIHHTASWARMDQHQFDAVNRYHKNKGWGMIGYHWFIERDGTIVKGRAENKVGAHCYQWLMNYRSIGICMAGDFDRQVPSHAQELSLKRLITEVQIRNGMRNGRIKLHRDFAKYKSCPGANLGRDYFDDIIFGRDMRRRIRKKPLPDRHV